MYRAGTIASDTATSLSALQPAPQRHDCRTCSSVNDMYPLTSVSFCLRRLSFCGRCSAHLPAQNPIQIRVAKAALWIDPVANGAEAVPQRVALPQSLRRLVVQLAPVRPAVEGVHDRL